MIKRAKLYFWIFVLLFSAIALFILINGGITGNPIYKIYTIENFPGIYVDFGPTQAESSSKWGGAAVGNMGELWNAPFLENSQYTFLPLKYSNGDLSNMNIQMSHLDKSDGIKSNLGDSMFDTYVYSQDINKVSSISISNLISGEYDLYLYGNLEEANANYELYKYSYKTGTLKSTFYGLASTYVNSDVLLKENWEEKVHYIVYKDIPFDEGDSLEIIIKSFDKNGERAFSFISGMQIVKAGTKLAYNVSSSSNKLDCFDSDGGINYSISGKIYINGRYSSEDLCDNQNTFITELSCEQGIKSIDIHKCENGCVDGFCIPDFKFLACDGCLFNQICLSKGTRIENKYCDLDKFLKIQKAEINSCLNDFECNTNSCVDNACEKLETIAKRELGIKYNFVKIVCRISNFDSVDFESCLMDSFTPLIDDKKSSEIKVENKKNNSIFNNNYNISQEKLPDASID